MSNSIAILGSTGSIGKQTLQVIDHLNSSDQADLEVVGLSCGSNIDLLEKQIRKFRPRYVSVKEDLREKAKEAFPEEINLYSGEEGLEKLASLRETDTVVNALVGFIGLKPTLKAAEKDKKILLANKESLVVGGKLVIEALDGDRQSRLIPIDSEHSAVKQCLRSGKRGEVRRLIITASGGPFRDWPLDRIKTAGPEEALDHPNWSMGTRITCDSATMVNKAFEVIEAHWLFELPYEEIDALIHHQSIIHSMVEFRDGTVMAQLGPPDMKGPIQYALTHPRRMENDFHRLNLLEAEKLSFKQVNKERYPAFDVLLQAARAGGNEPAALNAADEQLVDAFTEEKIKFGAITEGLKIVRDRLSFQKDPDYSQLREVDRWARKEVKKLVREGKLSQDPCP